MTLKLINNVWHRLSYDEYVWRETRFTNADVAIGEALKGWFVERGE